MTSISEIDETPTGLGAAEDVPRDSGSVESCGVAADRSEAETLDVEPSDFGQLTVSSTCRCCPQLLF